MKARPKTNRCNLEWMGHHRCVCFYYVITTSVISVCHIQVSVNYLSNLSTILILLKHLKTLYPEVPIYLFYVGRFLYPYRILRPDVCKVLLFVKLVIYVCKLSMLGSFRCAFDLVGSD